MKIQTNKGQPIKQETTKKGKITEDIVSKVKGFLRKEGVELFRGYKKKYNEISPVFMDKGIPHAVHFNEGMQIRNYLRSLPDCKEWTCDQLDNTWQRIVEKAIK